MMKLIALTGSGISAESGLKTFRDSNGLWEEYRVEDVATPEAWEKDMNLVLRFYNERRAQLATVQPNKGHLGLKKLEKNFDVSIITQNVDDLHERAGSTNILHLHGLLTQARSTGNENDIIDIGYKPINPGDKCKKGFQLRPHIVWFGEAVPEISHAAMMVSKADILVIIGTSLNVYPAASLIDYAPQKTPVFVIDPGEINIPSNRDIIHIKEKAGVGMDKLITLLKKYL